MRFKQGERVRACNRANEMYGLTGTILVVHDDPVPLDGFGRGGGKFHARYEVAFRAYGGPLVWETTRILWDWELAPEKTNA